MRPDGSTKVRPVDHLSWWSDPDATGNARMSKKRMKVHVAFVENASFLYAITACDLQEASVNGKCVIPEKIKHHHLDDLIDGMKHFISVINVLPGLWKADVDAAFRRIPLRPEHRWAAAIVFACKGVVCV